MTDRVVIASDTDAGILVMAVQGELDLYSAPELRARLLAAIDDGADSVVLDLRETTFMDSTALGVIVAAMKALRAQDGRLVLVNESRSIAKTLAITGLDEMLAVERTVDAAVVTARDV
jgi:anti-sigma B factor antagonist